MRLKWLLLTVCLTACSTISLQDTAATTAAENRAIVTEAAQIRQTIQFAETQAMATSVAAETRVAQANNANALLLATVRAGDPPTVQVRAQLDRSVGSLQRGTPEPNNPARTTNPAGDVISTYTTSAIQDADGCGQDRQSQFDLGTFRVFAVQQVANIPADTLVGIEWYYAGEVALADQLLVTEAANSLCIWFYLEPYSTGNWSLQFISNGTPVGERVTFRVGE
jgi:hypothetical protein